MNNFLLDLLALRKSIIKDGWLIFPPGEDNLLRFRVEWYLDGEKYGFERIVTRLEMENSIDLAQKIIDEANRVFENAITAKAVKG